MAVGGNPVLFAPTLQRADSAMGTAGVASLLKGIPHRIPAAMATGHRKRRPGLRAAARAADVRALGAEAAANRRAPFALGDPVQLHALVEEAEFQDIDLRTMVDTVRFPDPESLVAYQLAATPMSTLGAVTEEAHQAVARDVRAALQLYLHDGQLAVPMEAHLVLARA